MEYVGPGLILTYGLARLWQLRPTTAYLVMALVFMGIAIYIMRDLSPIRILFICIFMHLHEQALADHLRATE